MPSYAEEQKLLADQAIQGYLQNPQPAPVDQQALGQAALAGMPPAPPPVDTQALGQVALGGAPSPGLSPADQQALGQAALAGYGGAPPPAQEWTDPNQPGPGAVTDEQMLAASAPGPAPMAMAAVPPAAQAGAVAPTDIAPPPEAAQAAPEAQAAPDAQAAPELVAGPTPKTFTESLDFLTTANKQKADAEIEQARVESGGLAQTAALSADQRKELGDRLTAHETRIKSQFEDMQTLIANVRAANEKAEELSHIEHKETTRSKIAGLLATFGAGLADAFAIRGGNMNPQYLAKAQEGLDKAVAMDLAKQRERYSNAKESAKSKNDELNLAIKMFGDTPEANEYANLLTGKRMGMELAEQAASAKSDVAKAAGTAVAAGTLATGAKDMATLLERLAAAKYAGQARAAGDNRTYSAPELAEQQAAGVALPQKAHAIANAYNASVRAQHGADSREQTAEEKKAAAAALERAEIIPGLMRRPNMVPLSDPQMKEITSHYASTTGVAFLADKAAQLWEVVMDETRPKEERMAARAEFDGIRGRLQSGESVNTGQGTITASDAARTDGAMPKLPPEIDIEGIGTWARNKFQGKTPNAETFRRMSMSAMEEADTKLRKSYGLVPVEEGTRLWAEHDAKKKPKGESAPKGETKPAAAADMVTFELNGNKGSVPADQAEAFQKRYPAAKRL